VADCSPVRLVRRHPCDLHDRSDELLVNPLLENPLPSNADEMAPTIFRKTLFPGAEGRYGLFGRDRRRCPQPGGAGPAGPALAARCRRRRRRSVRQMAIIEGEQFDAA
jgi:hypothetical protein